MSALFAVGDSCQASLPLLKKRARLFVAPGSCSCHYGCCRHSHHQRCRLMRVQRAMTETLRLSIPADSSWRHCGCFLRGHPQWTRATKAHTRMKTSLPVVKNSCCQQCLSCHRGRFCDQHQVVPAARTRKWPFLYVIANDLYLIQMNACAVCHSSPPVLAPQYQLLAIGQLRTRGVGLAEQLRQESDARQGQGGSTSALRLGGPRPLVSSAVLEDGPD
mmetsp:Transcript_61972/g.117192  ORF Transcript_61972/g.117192 Transcript_61972/m.117192 type:complete len:218 (+) Transcript_61972:390-1043(+)